MESPLFELRILHDHVYKMESLYEGLGTEELKACFLRFCKALPPVIYGETSEEKLLFVRVYVVLRAKLDCLTALCAAAENATSTMGFGGRVVLQAGWLEPWREPAVLRKWAEIFEQGASGIGSGGKQLASPT
jgi:hypothetical protein